MPGQDVCARLVVEHSAQPVAECRRGEPGSDACFAHDVHIGALLDQQFKQRVPSAICRTEKGVFVKCCYAVCAESQGQQEFDGLDGLLFW